MSAPNFLDLRCPACGDDCSIDIVAQIWVRIAADGTDTDASHCGDHEFTPDSTAVCTACDRWGTVREFEPKDEEVVP
jgi:hypothetical protein